MKDVIKYTVWALMVIWLLHYSHSIASINAEIDKWVAGKYGAKCYEDKQAHGNIKYLIEFNSLDDCLTYINN